MEFVEKIKVDLKESLSEKRYLHCLRVGEEAQKLARIYGYDEAKAYVAGILHDIAKEFSDLENARLVRKYQLEEELLKPEYRRILHARVGADVVRERYGLDEDICHAIYCHTTGEIEMNLLDKIIFVADKIEPGKSYEGIEEERALAYQNITAAMILCIRNNHQKLIREGKVIYPKSLEVLKKLESEVKTNGVKN